MGFLLENKGTMERIRILSLPTKSCDAGPGCQLKPRSSELSFHRINETELGHCLRTSFSVEECSYLNKSIIIAPLFFLCFNRVQQGRTLGKLHRTYK